MMIIGKLNVVSDGILDKEGNFFCLMVSGDSVFDGHLFLCAFFDTVWTVVAGRLSYYESESGHNTSNYIPEGAPNAFWTRRNCC